MSDKSIKVTDKRMFTPEGELREEFRNLEAEDAGAQPGVGAAEVPDPVPAAAPVEPEPEAGERNIEQPREQPILDAAARETVSPEPRPEGSAEPWGEAPPQAPGGERLEFPGTPEELGGPAFIDLLAMLANPAAIYLGDAQLPDGESVEDLNLARWHIDLLDVLRTKTAGNLAAQESAAVDDLLYQLRLRYVQKMG